VAVAYYDQVFVNRPFSGRFREPVKSKLNNLAHVIGFYRNWLTPVLAFWILLVSFFALEYWGKKYEYLWQRV